MIVADEFIDSLQVLQYFEAEAPPANAEEQPELD